MSQGRSICGAMSWMLFWCALLVCAFPARAEFRLHMERDDGRPLISWSNVPGIFYDLRMASAPGNPRLTETPFVASDASIHWTPSVFAGNLPIIMGRDLGYLFRITAISNDPYAGTARIEWAGRTGSTYRILRTANPANWNVASIADGIPGEMPFTSYDDISAGEGPQYYAVEEWVDEEWVRSENAAGFYTINLPLHNSSEGASVYVLLGNNFAPLDGQPYTFDRLIGSQLPVGTTAHVWRAYGAMTPFAGTGGVAVVRTPDGWEPASEIVERGQAFFIFSHLAEEVTKLSFGGELPSAPYAEVTTIPIVDIPSKPTSHALRYPYPVDIRFTNMTIWKEASPLDLFVTWDPIAAEYSVGWLEVGPPTNVLHRGVGFYLVHPTNAPDKVWHEPKPYDWP